MDLTGASAVFSQQQERQSQPSPKSAYVSMVDPFLVEALQNPRYRLTVLWMELDILKFLQNSDQKQFEFPHFSTSYLRLAAHRVAHHYDLQTVVQHNADDSMENRIFVIKKPEHKFPVVCLSDVPATDTEDDYKPDAIRVVIKPRPKDSANNATESAVKSSQVRTIEERMEEYDRARARIFSSTSNEGSEGKSGQDSPDTAKLSVGEDKGLWNRETFTTSRAILRDREKELTDPDYDRSYDRYARSGQSFNVPSFYVHEALPPFVQYDPGFPQWVQKPPINYRIPMLSPYSATGSTQHSCEALHMQWPMQSMIHAQSYDQRRHGFFQAPFYQQPLSFDYSENCHR